MAILAARAGDQGGPEVVCLFRDTVRGAMEALPACESLRMSIQISINIMTRTYHIIGRLLSFAQGAISGFLRFAVVLLGLGTVCQRAVDCCTRFAPDLMKIPSRRKACYW